MTLLERLKQNLKTRKERVENNLVNCIPLPFKRFRSELPGIEQGKYYLVSGQTKSAKTQLANFLFVYNTVLYCYRNPGVIHPKIFFYPLEETKENITLRFMAYLLNKLSRNKYRFSPTELKSTDETKPLPDEVLRFMDTMEFKTIMDLYESIISFEEDKNPTGIYKTLTSYAANHGKTVYKTIEKDDGTKVEKFDYYIPDDPDEYVFIIVDHVSLLETERRSDGSVFDLRETINKLSEYMIILRNRYGYIPVVIQQQSTETASLEAFKANKIRPTMAGLSDSKYTAKDANVMLGITNPNQHELPMYNRYDITKFQSNLRIMEVVLNRDGQSNGMAALYFDGAINDFQELPRPDNSSEINEFYKRLEVLRTRPNILFITINKNYRDVIQISSNKGRLPRK